MRHPRKAAALILSIFVAGCAPSFTMSPISPLAGPLNEYRFAYLACESNTTEDVVKELTDLRGMALSNILGLGVFEHAQLASSSDQYEEGDLLIKVSVQNIRKVGGAKRFMLGAFAGKASMEINIQFVDASNDRVLGSYLAKGESGGTGISGGTSDAVAKTAEAIGNVIASHFRPIP